MKYISASEDDDMKEQNLDAPVYSENEQAVILLLKNNIEQRNVKQKAVSDDIGTQYGTNEELIIGYIKNDPTASSKKNSTELNIPLRTIQRVLTVMQEAGIIKNDGSRKKNTEIINIIIGGTKMSNWHPCSSDFFVLHTHGDSIIDAGIDEGGYGCCKEAELC